MTEGHPVYCGDLGPACKSGSVLVLEDGGSLVLS